MRYVLKQDQPKLFAAVRAGATSDARWREHGDAERIDSAIRPKSKRKPR